VKPIGEMNNDPLMGLVFHFRRASPATRCPAGRDPEPGERRMSSFRTVQRLPMARLGAALAIYIVMLAVLTIRVVSAYDGAAIAVALSATCAFFARRALNGDGRTGPFGQVLLACRELPPATRLPGAMVLVLVALLFDRFLDGDPRHFRMATFVVPIILSIILFDRKAAMFAIAMSILGVDYFLVPPVGAFLVTRLSDALDLLLYLGICLQIVLAIDMFLNSGEGRAP
jgi:Domain of unknown function (DUF4118)